MIDMAGVSEADLEKVIAARCTRYGRVASVRVVLPAGPARFAVALVRMSTVQALDDLIVRVGGTKSRSTAIIRLEQGERDAALHA
jgi:hypothetical protein